MKVALDCWKATLRGKRPEIRYAGRCKSEINNMIQALVDVASGEELTLKPRQLERDHTAGRQSSPAWAAGDHWAVDSAKKTGVQEGKRRRSC